MFKEGYTKRRMIFAGIVIMPVIMGLVGWNVLYSKAHQSHHIPPAHKLPKGCVDDGKTDYPGAINCIIDPATYDCNQVSENNPCTYTGAARPDENPLNFVVIHDIEGTLQNALNIFQKPELSVSIHYIVDTDGTIYQLLHEQDIAYHAANYFYNQRSIGVEHVGYDATGFLWYNAAQYRSSARLVAYLLNKYHIPLDHDHILSHGLIPAIELSRSPNHVDPGPYWMWSYYLHLIEELVDDNQPKVNEQTFMVQSERDRYLAGDHGTESPANFAFFYLYQEPSTRSNLLPQDHRGSDITDETASIETNVSYYYLDKKPDRAGSGLMMYKIWYGAESNLYTASRPANQMAHAQIAWLAAPEDDICEGHGIPVILKSYNAQSVKIYSFPNSQKDDSHVIGDAPEGAVFVSALHFTASELSGSVEGINQDWYEINYNHRQAWVPLSEIAIFS